MSGVESRRIVLFGDSHVHAVQEALKRREESGEAAALTTHRLLKTKAPAPHRSRVALPSRWKAVAQRWKLITGRAAAAADAGEMIGDTSFEAFLGIAAGLRPSDVLVSVIGGNQHAVFSTIQHPQPFDFYLPGEVNADVDPSATLIPYRTLYGYFITALRDGDGRTIAALRDATRAKVVHLLAPPPKRDNAFIEQNHDTHFASEGISNRGVSAPQLRLKFWRLQNCAVEEICAELGVETVPPPVGAFDADGFLDRRYYAGDATHANELYGELVIQDLEQRFA